MEPRDRKTERPGDGGLVEDVGAGWGGWGGDDVTVSFKLETNIVSVIAREPDKSAADSSILLGCICV